MEFPYRWGGPTYISIPNFLIFFHDLNDAKMQRNFFFFGGGGYPYSQVFLRVIFCSYTFEQTNKQAAIIDWIKYVYSKMAIYPEHQKNVI